MKAPTLRIVRSLSPRLKAQGSGRGTSSTTQSKPVASPFGLLTPREAASLQRLLRLWRVDPDLAQEADWFLEGLSSGLGDEGGAS